MGLEARDSQLRCRSKAIDRDLRSTFDTCANSPGKTSADEKIARKEKNVVKRVCMGLSPRS